MSKALFVKQLTKGKAGELAFREMAQSQWDEVYDYTNYEMWKDVQGKGIDYGFKNKSWSSEITTDVKSNFCYNKYNNCYQFDLEYTKWHPAKFSEHGREEELGWIQDSQSNRIYHMEIIQENNKWIATGSYVYYDLYEMRSFIYREWDRPEHNNWIQKIAYIGTKQSDYAHLIPVKLDDKRFKHLIRKVHYVETC
jgi:hypothetical protein